VTALLTDATVRALQEARGRAPTMIECSLDLGRSQDAIAIEADRFGWQGQWYDYPVVCRPRTVYRWDGSGFVAVSRFEDGLVKLVPTSWGPPTFEIDGVKMLPSAQLSPLEDARRKVALIEPENKVILDCCGGLGYFAGWCLEQGAKRVVSFERNAAVLWLRGVNPWSPAAAARLDLRHGNVREGIETLAPQTFDAVLHDPPRFAHAGELYSLAFYQQLARVMKRRGALFHYTGAPNKISRGRDLPGEVIERLHSAGFSAQRSGDGVLARRL
jgi:predicted methyltransferase